MNPIQTCPPLTRRASLWWGLCGTAFTATALHLTAQVAAPPPDTAATATTTEDAITLSPFEVSTNRDVGFAPNSALTGGRMALQLKDSPMAYSALTREFMDALAITDLTSASQWSVNSAKILDPVGGGDTFNLTVLAIQRGAGSSANRQVNFFPHFAPFDSYRMERIDFGRGPNAVMFGTGTLGGSQVALTKRADFSKAFQQVTVGVGSYDFYRTSIDVNQPIGKYVAARFNGLYQKADGWRDFAQDDNKAISGTISVRPTSKLELRLEGESGENKRQIPYLQHTDQFAGWNGVTTFSGPMTDAIRAGTVLPATGGALTTNGDVQGVSRRGANYYVYNPSSGLKGVNVIDYENDPDARGAGATNVTPVAGYTYGSNASFNSSGGPLLFGSWVDLPDARFNTIYSSPYTHFSLPSQTFTNSYKGPQNSQWYKDVQLTMSEAITDNLHLEVGGIFARADSEINGINGALYDTYIDINRLLPTGDANPNFGRLYSDSGVYGKTIQFRETKAIRASLGYVKNLGKWGDYGFNLMGGSNRQELDSGANLRYSLAINPDHRRWADLDTFRIRHYWGDPISGDPPGGPINLIDSNYGASGTNYGSGTAVTPRWILNNTGASPFQFATTRYKYGLFGGNAKFLNDHLVLTGAVRYDSYTQSRKESVRQADYPADWDGRSMIFRPDAPADYFSLKYLPKSAAGVVNGSEQFALSRPTTTNAAGAQIRAPQYAGDRFQDDYNAPAIKNSKTSYAVGGIVHVTSWVSLGYNRATSYSLPSVTTPAIDGSILPPTTGEGWDASVRFTLFKGKLNVNYNHYDNQEQGTYVSAGGGLGQVTTTGPINGLYAANEVHDRDTAGRNARGVADLFGPANDIRDRVNKGDELEIVGNVTRGWRISGSISKNDLKNVNSFPMSLKYIAGHKDVFIQILQDAGGVLDTSTPIAPGAPGTARTRTLVAGEVGLDQQSAVDNYNNIYLNAANYQTNPVVTLNNIIVNVFSDYTIQTGKLKDLRFGVGYQYRGRLVAGYRGSDTIVDPANPTKAIDNPKVDAYTPVFTPSYDNWTGSLGYTWRFKKGHSLVFNLRIDNLLGQTRPAWSDGIVLRPLNGDYTSPARETVASRLGEFRQPRSYMMTTTLKF